MKGILLGGIMVAIAVVTLDLAVVSILLSATGAILFVSGLAYELRDRA